MLLYQGKILITHCSGLLFLVSESIVQCSGIFNVKVARNGTGLGITISGR